MTVVAIWLEREVEGTSLWSIADTRISQKGPTGGTTIMTDTGAKLFAIPIRCHQGSVRQAARYSTSIGFAFAGSVLPATMTVATASTFLQNLLTDTFRSPPPLKAVAETIRRLAERFSKDSLASSAGSYGKFEAAVFGWCPILNRFAIYRLTPLDDGFQYFVQSEELLLEIGPPMCFGTGASRLADHIIHIREHGDEFHRTALVPKLAIEALLKEDQLPDVGGGLSIGIANKETFQLYSHVTPIVPGQPAARFSFNGIELDQNNLQVDGYLISINGIA